MFSSIVHISPTTSLEVGTKSLLCWHRVMAQPPQIQRPLQVRAQDILANAQADLPVPQGPQPAVAVPAPGPAHVAEPEVAEIAEVAGPHAVPDPPLEVKQPFSFLPVSFTGFSLFLLLRLFLRCMPLECGVLFKCE